MTVKIRRRSTGATFIHPMDPTPRTAILAPGFRPTKLIRVFPSGWNEEAERFQPSSIAGPPDQLRRLVDRNLQLHHAVIVFSWEDGSGLSDDDRDLFWESFGVPIFEQRLGAGNELLAMECDAHNGLHVMGEFGNLRMDRNTCACGNPAPRLPKRSRMEDLADMLA